MPSSSPTSSSLSLSVTAEKLMPGAQIGSALVAVAIGVSFDPLATALVVGGLLTVPGAAAALVASGTPASRLVLASCLMGTTALHIQLGRGTLEFHFGVFATLALLLVYRDWRPVLAAAGLIAVHHVLFDRLQAGGTGVYCMTQPDFLKVLVHAG